MTISENNQELEEELQELESRLIEANKYVASIENRISFRPKGQAGKWTSELNKAKKQRDIISSNITRIKSRDMFKETDEFIKDSQEKERIRKEKERVYALFKEYKENPISIPIEKQMEKPDFSSIGDEIIDRNYEAVKKAQIEYNSAYQKAQNRSSVGKGNRASQLQKSRNRLEEARFDVSHEPILTEFRELFAEVKWLKKVIAEGEAEAEEVQAIIYKVEKDISLFEKHGLIEPKK